MLQLDFSAKLLDMEYIDLNKVKTTAPTRTISFSMRKRPHTCPNYGSITGTVHDYRLQVVKDIPMLDKHLI